MIRYVNITHTSGSTIVTNALVRKRGAVSNGAAFWARIEITSTANRFAGNRREYHVGGAKRVSWRRW